MKFSMPSALFDIDNNVLYGRIECRVLTSRSRWRVNNDPHSSAPRESSTSGFAKIRHSSVAWKHDGRVAESQGNPENHFPSQYVRPRTEGRRVTGLSSA